MTSFDSVKESLQGTPSSAHSVIESASSLSQSPCPSHSTTIKDAQIETKQRYLFVPDMFSSIMSVKPVVNPNYHDVKPKADAWITKIIHADEKWATRNSKVDLAYLASIWAPICDEEALRLMVDWNHWVFLFDDQFDEGHLRSNPEAAQEEIDRTLAIMEDSEPAVRPEDNAIRYVFQTTWDRVKKCSSPVLQLRWKNMHRNFFEGLLKQVQDMYDGRTFTRDIQEYLDMRRGTIGAFPAISLTEIAIGIKVPQDVVDHPSLRECMCVSADLVLLVNDILSYKKDLALGVDHNLITLLMEHGLPAQQAIDKIGVMLDDCYKRWYNALANMPVWGESTDREVLKYVNACRDVALGNLYWSFKTGRYLGAEGNEVHETRRLSLPPGFQSSSEANKIQPNTLFSHSKNSEIGKQ